MRNKSTVRRVSTAVTAAAVLTGALALPQAAPAAPAPLTDVTAATTLAATLGDDRTGGVYYDDTGRLVVAVTDEAAADAVKAAGGVAELVAYSTAQLESVHTALDDDIAFTDPIDGTSWGADPSENQVVVEYDSTVTGDDLARLKEKVDSYGGAARLDYVGGEMKLTGTMVGGVGIKENNSGADGQRCTGGFNVQNANGKKFLLTAGHCMLGGAYWWERWSSGEYIGKQTAFGVEGKDYAVIEYLSDITPYGTIMVGGNEHQIVAARYPVDSEPVQRVGSTSSDLVGTILDPSTTVTVQGWTMTRMIKTTLCALGGDSGGPLFRQGTALGLTSSSNSVGACNSSVSEDRTYYTPVQYVLNTWNLDVY